MIKSRRSTALFAGIVTLGFGLAIGCGEEEKSGEFSTSVGKVAMFADGPKYSIALTSATSGDDVTYSLDAAKDKVALTEWHEVSINQSPANCAGKGLAATFADGKWSFKVAKAVTESTEKDCKVTVSAGMGETVEWSWVADLLEGKAATGDKDDAGDDVKTKSCSGCHGSFGDYSMKNGGTFSYAAVVSEKEKDTDKDTIISIDFGGNEGDACDPNDAKFKRSMKRIAAGDPANSFLVQITNVKKDGDATFAELGGNKAFRCEDNALKGIFMPWKKPKASAPGLPADDNGNVHWPQHMHKKFAQWVLQGAKGPE